ncbi:AAA family ATPase [Providencia hangzhouensis]|uniref:AAA family ATPase n=1 Tax=Providencia hangzhouensis TaxID=3031799 RepID=UPI0034DD19BC
MNLTEASPLLKKQPRLHFLCGKIASGKSTLAKQLANLPRTILLCEDEMACRPLS